MQPADHFVEDGFLLAGGLRFVRFGDVETVLFIHQFPDGLAVVVGVRLDVRVQVKVLALVVFLVFHVPDPVHGG